MEGEPPEFKRSPEDLRMYNQFFPELFEIDIKEDSDSIVIPTASYDSGMDRSRDRQMKGQGRDKGAFIYPMTAENLHKSVSCPSSLFRMQTCSSDYSTDTSGYSSGRTSLLRNPQMYETEYIESFTSVRPDTAMAVNLKTGASVISLDFPSQTNKSSNSNSRKQTAPKSKKAKGSKKSNNRDKKSKRLTKESNSVQNNMETVTAFTDALCITPIPSSREQEDEMERPLSGYDDDDESVELSHDPLMYQDLARVTKSVYKYEKVAYPDLCGAKSPYDAEPLYHRKFGVQR